MIIVKSLKVGWEVKNIEKLEILGIINSSSRGNYGCKKKF